MNTLFRVLKTKPSILNMGVLNIGFKVVFCVLISIVCWKFLDQDFNNMSATSQLKWQLIAILQVLALFILFTLFIRSQSTITKLVLSIYIFLKLLLLLYSQTFIESFYTPDSETLWNNTYGYLNKHYLILVYVQEIILFQFACPIILKLLRSKN